MHTTIDGLIEQIKRDREEQREGELVDRLTRKVVSVRLDAGMIANLENIAQAWGTNRTACAEELLETAIYQVGVSLGIFDRLQRQTGTLEETTITSEKTGRQTRIKDDALQIGEENRP